MSSPRTSAKSRPKGLKSSFTLSTIATKETTISTTLNTISARRNVDFFIKYLLFFEEAPRKERLPVSRYNYTPG